MRKGLLCPAELQREWGNLTHLTRVSSDASFLGDNYRLIDILNSHLIRQRRTRHQPQARSVWRMIWWVMSVGWRESRARDWDARTSWRSSSRQALFVFWRTSATRLPWGATATATSRGGPRGILTVTPEPESSRSTPGFYTSTYTLQSEIDRVFRTRTGESLIVQPVVHCKLTLPYIRGALALLPRSQRTRSRRVSIL